MDQEAEQPGPLEGESPPRPMPPAVPLPLAVPERPARRVSRRVVVVAVVVAVLLLAACAGVAALAWSQLAPAVGFGADVVSAATTRRDKEYPRFDLLNSQASTDVEYLTCDVFFLQENRDVPGFRMVVDYTVSGLGKQSRGPGGSELTVTQDDVFFTTPLTPRATSEAFMRRWVADHKSAPVWDVLEQDETEDGKTVWWVTYYKDSKSALGAGDFLEAYYEFDPSSGEWAPSDYTEP